MTIKRYLPGFFLVLLIALFSFFLSTINASFDALVISIIIGMFFGNVFNRHHVFSGGMEGALQVFLPLGIALYGTQLAVNELRGGMVLLILLVFAALFLLTLLLARVFGLNPKASVLLASGLAVCGATAIAVISPIIGARREDTSISIISVMMLGLTGMLFYPIVNDIAALSNTEFNFLVGTTLPMLGQVKVAAASVCPDCLDRAVKIKVIRMSFLLFAVIAAIVFAGKEKKEVRAPWFIVVFVLLAVIANATSLLSPLLGQFKSASTFLLSAGLAAIGYSADFDAIIDEGLTPLGVAFLSWGVIVLLMYLVRNLF